MAGRTGTGFNRDRLAKSYAQRHLKTDPGVVEIHYLPKDAPDREIRFLEVNTMIPETPPEPIDFGVAIGGANAHTLYVLDVTPAQWETIQTKAMSLPTGWTLDGSQELGRR